MSEIVLSVAGLAKNFGGLQAVRGVDFNVEEGAIVGLIGPNGAGKSTLMRTIATLQEADEGTMRLGDLNLLTQKEEVRKILGYLPQEFGLYPRISAEVLLDHFAVLKGIVHKGERKEIVKALLHKTNLYEDRKKKLSTYSGGMKQRFGIAQALLAEPRLLIVDEPTAGLDPAERNRFHNLLSELGERCIIILSTHIVEDVKELCPNMAILNQGKVQLQGKPQELINQLQGKVYKKYIKPNQLEAYRAAYTIIADKRLHGRPIIHVYSETALGDGFLPVTVELDDVYFSQIFAPENAR